MMLARPSALLRIQEAAAAGAAVSRFSSTDKKVVKTTNFALFTLVLRWESASRRSRSTDTTPRSPMPSRSSRYNFAFVCFPLSV